MRNIVFVNQSSGYLMIDIVNAFGGGYSERAIIAGSVKPRSKKLSHGVIIRKVKAYENTTKIKRLITWSISFIQIILIIKRHYKDAELFLVSNPPFTVFIPLFCSNTFSLLIYDIYPDALVASGMIKKSAFPIRFWEKVNKRVFIKSKKIFTISDGMKNELAKYVDRKKIDVVPLWTDNELMVPIPKRKNRFLMDHGLDGKFLVLYSGNLGFTHDVEVILDLAEKFHECDDFYFLIIGDGEKKEILETRIERQRLKNCKLLPLQPVEMLPYTFSAADIAVVTLSSFASKLSVPSKTFNYLSAGAPLLCVANKESELASLVEKYDVGCCFQRKEIDDMVHYIMGLKNDPETHSRIKSNALKASEDFTRKNAQRFVDVLR